MDHLHITAAPEIRSSLAFSWKEGIASNAMIVIVENYLTPFALFLGCAPQQIGFLVALPHFLGSVSQLFAVRAVRFAGSRLQFLINATTAQASLLVPVALLAFLPFRGRFLTLLALIIAFRVLANLIQTAWGSLVSDYLCAEERGRYFGWRSQVVGVAGVVVVGMAGLALFATKRMSGAFGFSLIFLTAAACRLVSSQLFRFHTDRPLQPTPGGDFTFLMFLRRFRESNFVKYVLYVSGITFATQLAAPYFSVYMLKDLHFNYISYTLIQLVSVSAGLVSFPVWGRHADLVGNAKVLKITSQMIPWIPILWMFSGHLGWLIPVEIFSGFVWGGFNLCAANFIYDAVSPAKRVRCLGYFNLINGVAIFAGASIGGFLAESMPPFGGRRILSLFLLSGILRFLAHFFLAGKFHEVRTKVKKVSSLQLFFSVLGIRPLSFSNGQSH